MTSLTQSPAMEQHVTLNEPAVISDLIDGEWVIMNLGSGTYYGLDPLGSTLWHRLLSGDTPAVAARMIAAHYSEPEDVVAADVATFLTKLLEEGLVIAGSSTPGREDLGEAGLPAGPYAAPHLTRYEDMTRLLALDPPLPA